MCGFFRYLCTISLYLFIFKKCIKLLFNIGHPLTKALEKKNWINKKHKVPLPLFFFFCKGALLETLKYIWNCNFQQKLFLAHLVACVMEDLSNCMIHSCTHSLTSYLLVPCVLVEGTKWCLCFTVPPLHNVKHLKPNQVALLRQPHIFHLWLSNINSKWKMLSHS